MCDACGVRNVRSPVPANLTVGTEKVVKWTAWEMMQKGNSKARDLVDKEDTLEQMIRLLIKELESFQVYVHVQMAAQVVLRLY